MEIKKGMLAPTLVQMERQIDREIAADNKANGVCDNKNDNGNNIASSGQDDLFDSDSEDECENEDPMLMYGPQQQIVTNDLKSLDEMVNIIILLEMNVYKYWYLHLYVLCWCLSQYVNRSDGNDRNDDFVEIFIIIL